FFPPTSTFSIFPSSRGFLTTNHSMLSLSIFKDNKKKRRRWDGVSMKYNKSFVSYLLEFLRVYLTFVFRQVNFTQTDRLWCHLNIFVCLDIFHTFFQGKFDGRCNTYVII